MEKEWDIVEVLRHSRHDWLNKLQLIKGNLDLNRIERAKEVINEIVIEAQHETKLSNLELPLFVSILLRCNWENPYFKLEYEVLQDTGSVHIDDAILSNWTKSFLECLNTAIERFQENHLSITIDMETEGVRFFFDFSGIIINTELLQTFLASVPEKMDMQVKELSDSEISIEVYMSFNE